MTDKTVFRIALDDAIDWNVSLLDALHEDDEYVARVRHVLKRLREVRAKYFGERPDPFKNAELVPLAELRLSAAPPTDTD